MGSQAISASTEQSKLIDFTNKAFFKMKPNPEFSNTVADILLGDEAIIESFSSMRDGVVFTDRRVIAVNVQGITGRKKDFTSMPYSKVVAFSIETAGTFDLDAELDLSFSGLGTVRFEFTGKVDMKRIARTIGTYVLQ
jgi:hypothetical protein